MNSYRATWKRPHCEKVFEAADDAAAYAIIAAHPRGSTDLCVLVPGREYPESEDGYRRAGRLPDKWVYVCPS